MPDERDCITVFQIAKSNSTILPAISIQNRKSQNAKSAGGEGGIRTHGTRKGTAIFETARFNHSRTSPHEPPILNVSHRVYQVVCSKFRTTEARASRLPAADRLPIRLRFLPDSRF